MELFNRLFGPRRRKTQDDIAGRAAEVVVQVLYDIGVDRFMAGSFLLDRRFRISFYAVPPRPAPNLIASVRVQELGEARAFREHVALLGFNAALRRDVAPMVEELMRVLQARSPDLCALPRERTGKALAG